MDPRPNHNTLTARYEHAPYQSHACLHSHPANLAAVAMLLGLSPPKVAGCRVLEVGSGTGSNLLPMAEDLRDAEFVGIDLSARQVEMSQAAADALHLGNVKFLKLDLMEATQELGQFDYIIAHGLYAWVPPPVRERLLQLCREHLLPEGLAYISYNTLPGWYFPQMLRDFFQFHGRDVGDDPAAEAEAAEEALKLLLEGISPKSPNTARVLHAYAREYQDHLGSLGPMRESALHHDILADINQPLYFRDFAAAAERHQLQFVAEANPDFLGFSEVPQRAQEMMRQSVGSVIEMEQYLDFLQMRMFRQSVLCHEGREVQRALSAQRLCGVHVASRLRPASARPDLETPLLERFTGSGDVAVTSNHPMSKAALCALAQVRPGAVEFTELLRRARALLKQAPQEGDADGTCEDAQELMRLLLRVTSQRRDLVRLRAAPPRAVAARAGETLTGRLMARAQAAGSATVTNFYHETVTLEPMARWAMQRLDGTRGRAELLAELYQMEAAGKIKIAADQIGLGETRGVLEKDLDECLRTLSDEALLAESRPGPP